MIEDSTTIREAFGQTLRRVVHYDTFDWHDWVSPSGAHTRAVNGIFNLIANPDINPDHITVGDFRAWLAHQGGWRKLRCSPNMGKKTIALIESVVGALPASCPHCGKPLDS